MFRCIAAVAAFAVLLGVCSLSEAKVKVGDPIPAFSNLQTVDGKTISVGDLGKDVQVICVTCNHCPVAVAYEDRIIDFVKNHATADSKVSFLAINVNNLEADKLPKMKERAKEKGFNFTYAYDPSQKIAKELGASVTPEFYVFAKGKCVYMGAMDDDMQKPTVNYLEQAVKAGLTGAEAPKATKARGCGIKYDGK